MYDQIFSKMLALDRDDVDTMARFSHESRKTMIPVSFGVNGIGLVKILPEGAKRTSESFKDQIRQESYQRSCDSWRVEPLAHLTLHSDNPPVQKVRRVS
jgi:hypothetical protein